MVEKFRRVDWSLFLAMAGLVSFGLVMIYSSSAITAYEDFGSLEFFVGRQFTWMLIGLVGCFVVVVMEPETLRQITPILYWISIATLVLVLFPGIGTETGGARRWIDLGLFTYQPSEGARITLVLMLGAYLSDPSAGGRLGIRKLLGGLGLILLVAGLVVLAPDFGMAMLIFVTGCLILFVAGIPLRTIAVLFGISAPGIFSMIYFSGYRRARVMAYLNPWSDPLDQGFHTLQALRALGKGGFSGQGLGESLQKIRTLPEPFTDSIVAVIGEELGYLGVLFLIFLITYVTVRGFIVSLQSSNTFDRLIGVGICSLIGLQALINLSVVSALLPATGMTMPFVSYGGSSLVTNMTGIGILLNISRRS